MKSGSKMFTVDKFLGVNEAADGFTELKMGEASSMENFLVTDGCNLTLRPGIRRVDFDLVRDPAPVLAAWSGHVGEQELFILCDFADGTDRLFIYVKEDSGLHSILYRQDGALGLTAAEGAKVKIFSFASLVYVMSSAKTVAWADGAFVEQEPYVPLVIAGADPAGGGTTLESINLLTPLRRMTFSADGESTAFVLPQEAAGVTAVVIDNVETDADAAGVFDADAHTFTFSAAPVKGVGNVEITYTADPEAAEESRMQIVGCRLVEEYNGSTDTRLFMAGDGTNMCYYSGVTQSGQPSAMYFPALNEVAVDMSSAVVTGIVRHYSKLLVFKTDGAFTISYEAVTQADGSTIAGFYLRSMNREYGNECMGQIQTVKNYPRSITKDGIYEWRITSSYYKDERYANRISDMVKKSLKQADVSRIVTCDDDFDKTYYVFLNDDNGTVLVNRYDLGNDGGIWCIYRSELCRNVRFAMMHGGEMVFVNDTEAFRFDDSVSMDASPETGGESRQITALWESGYMHFGADFLRKYSSQIYISMLPQTNSAMTITAATDKRSEYLEKEISSSLFSWSQMSFSAFSFDTNDTPKIRRVRLKVKKFVYYKLIFKVVNPGARATVLGYDQEVRFASKAK